MIERARNRTEESVGPPASSTQATREYPIEQAWVLGRSNAVEQVGPRLVTKVKGRPENLPVWLSGLLNHVSSSRQEDESWQLSRPVHHILGISSAYQFSVDYICTVTRGKYEEYYRDPGEELRVYSLNLNERDPSFRGKISRIEMLKDLHDRLSRIKLSHLISILLNMAFQNLIFAKLMGSAESLLYWRSMILDLVTSSLENDESTELLRSDRISPLLRLSYTGLSCAKSLGRAKSLLDWRSTVLGLVTSSLENDESTELLRLTTDALRLRPAYQSAVAEVLLRGDWLRATTNPFAYVRTIARRRSDQRYTFADPGKKLRFLPLDRDEPDPSSKVKMSQIEVMHDLRAVLRRIKPPDDVVALLSGAYNGVPYAETAADMGWTKRQLWTARKRVETVKNQLQEALVCYRQTSPKCSSTVRHRRSALRRYQPGNK